jgi:hypothetical protein
VTKIMGSREEDWIQVLLITLNYSAIANLHTVSSLLHTHYDSPSSLVVSLKRISTQKLAP